MVNWQERQFIYGIHYLILVKTVLFPYYIFHKKSNPKNYICSPFTCKERDTRSDKTIGYLYDSTRTMCRYFCPIYIPVSSVRRCLDNWTFFFSIYETCKCIYSNIKYFALFPLKGIFMKTTQMSIIIERHIFWTYKIMKLVFVFIKEK